MNPMKMTLWLAIALLPLSAIAGREGNGGDPLAFEFEQSARDAIQDIQASAGEYPGIKAAELSATLLETKIVIVNEALHAQAGEKSQESAALNYPDTGTIYLNRARWAEIKSGEIRKALALHELLGLLGKEGTGRYPVSQRYLARRGVSCQENLCLSPPRGPGFSFSEAQRLFRDARMPTESELNASYRWVGSASAAGYAESLLDNDDPNRADQELNWFNPQGAGTLELKSGTSFSGSDHYHSASFLYDGDKSGSDLNLVVTLNPTAKAACFSRSAGSYQDFPMFQKTVVPFKSYISLQCRTLATDPEKLLCAQTLVVHPDETGFLPKKFNRRMIGYLAFVLKK